jgi:hypothetical protein
MLEYIKTNRIKPQKLHISSMKHEIRRQELNAINMAEHIIRVNNANLKHPIIIHYDGEVVD